MARTSFLLQFNLNNQVSFPDSGSINMLLSCDYLRQNAFCGPHIQLIFQTRTPANQISIFTFPKLFSKPKTLLKTLPNGPLVFLWWNKCNLFMVASFYWMLARLHFLLYGNFSFFPVILCRSICHYTRQLHLWLIKLPVVLLFLLTHSLFLV